MFNIIGKKWLFFLLSGLVIVPGAISLILWGLRPSIDFTGGTLLEIEIKSQKSLRPELRARAKVKSEEIKKIVDSQNIEAGSIQESGENTYLLRLKPIDKDQNKKLQEEIKKQLGELKELRFETVGPTVGKETTTNAIKAVIIAFVAIVLYIAFAFRGVRRPFSALSFGVCAIIAAFHDSLVLLGTFSLLGHFLKVEIDSLFITAFLTVIGFSVHDTIVVFDRIRENQRRMGNVALVQVVNESILQTVVRSLANSLTILFVLFAILLFGGETIRWFIVALFIGVVSGTYSSTFTAVPLMVVWNEKTRQKPS